MSSGRRRRPAGLSLSRGASNSSARAGRRREDRGEIRQLEGILPRRGRKPERESSVGDELRGEPGARGRGIFATMALVEDDDVGVRSGAGASEPLFRANLLACGLAGGRGSGVVRQLLLHAHLPRVRLRTERCERGRNAPTFVDEDAVSRVPARRLGGSDTTHGKRNIEDEGGHGLRSISIRFSERGRAGTARSGADRGRRRPARSRWR